MKLRERYQMIRVLPRCPHGEVRRRRGTGGTSTPHEWVGQSPRVGAVASGFLRIDMGRETNDDWNLRLLNAQGEKGGVYVSVPRLC